MKIEKIKAVAKFKWEKESQKGQIEVEKDDPVQIIFRGKSNWWFCESKGKRGFISSEILSFSEKGSEIPPPIEMPPRVPEYEESSEIDLSEEEGEGEWYYEEAEDESEGSDEEVEEQFSKKPKKKSIHDKLNPNKSKNDKNDKNKQSKGHIEDSERKMQLQLEIKQMEKQKLERSREELLKKNKEKEELEKKLLEEKKQKEQLEKRLKEKKLDDRDSDTSDQEEQSSGDDAPVVKESPKKIVLTEIQHSKKTEIVSLDDSHRSSIPKETPQKTVITLKEESKEEKSKKISSFNDDDEEEDDSSSLGEIFEQAKDLKEQKKIVIKPSDNQKKIEKKENPQSIDDSRPKIITLKETKKSSSQDDSSEKNLTPKKNNHDDQKKVVALSESPRHVKHQESKQDHSISHPPPKKEVVVEKPSHHEHKVIKLEVHKSPRVEKKDSPRKVIKLEEKKISHDSSDSNDSDSSSLDEIFAKAKNDNKDKKNEDYFSTVVVSKDPEIKQFDVPSENKKMEPSSRGNLKDLFKNPSDQKTSPEIQRKEPEISPKKQKESISPEIPKKDGLKISPRNRKNDITGDSQEMKGMIKNLKETISQLGIINVANFESESESEEITPKLDPNTGKKQKNKN